MSPELQKELASWLTRLREGADAAGSFALEQAPLVVQEKVFYGRVWETLLLVILLMIVLAAVRAFLWGRRYSSEKKERYDDTGDVVQIVSGITFGIVVLGIIAQLPTAVQVWIAPRLYVVEWLMELV